MGKQPINEGITRGTIKGGDKSTTAGVKKEITPANRPPAPPAPVKKK